MKSFLLVGSVGAGKTTLRQRLQGHEVGYAKTQAIEVHDGVIDTPGEFLESMFYKNALINAAWGVESVLLVQAADLRGTRFPPASPPPSTGRCSVWSPSAPTRRGHAVTPPSGC